MSLSWCVHACLFWVSIGLFASACAGNISESVGGGDSDEAASAGGQGGAGEDADGRGGAVSFPAASGGAGNNIGTGGSGQGGQAGTAGIDGAVTGGAGGSRDVVPKPTGLVPMFVAAGNGGRTITSCDDGMSWIANHAYDTEDVDHSPDTEKGFVYGNGLFVQLLGWGAGISAKVSANGVDWKRSSIPKGGGGLVFLSSPAPAFVTVGGYGGCSTSSNGETWKACAGPDFDSNLREAGGGGSALGAGGDIAAQFSFDAGKRWKSGGPCTAVGGFGNLGQEGGFAFGNNAFVVVSSGGDWCQTTDAGVTWKTGKLGGRATGKLSFAKDRFWAPNGRDVYFSDDGATWKHETFKPDGVAIHSMARGDSGTYVGVDRGGDGSRFFRSTDGITWTSVKGAGGASIRRVAFGYGQPSKDCPLR